MPYKIIILALLYIEMLIVTFGIQFIPPLLTQLIKTYSLNNSQCGILMGIVSVFGLFFCLPIGLYSRRIGFQKISILSLLLLAFGTAAMNFTNNFYLLCLFRMIAGIGIMTLAITLPSMLAYWFKHSEHGRAMGIFNTALPVGTILAFMLLGEISQHIKLSYIIWAIAILSLIGLVIFALLYRAPIQDQDKKTDQEKYSVIYFLKTEKNIWTLGFIWLFYNAAAISFSTFAINFFFKAGYSFFFAGIIAGTVVLGPLFLSPLLGVFIDKGLDAVKILIAGNSILFLGFAGLAIKIPLCISLLFLGIGAGLIPTAIYFYVPRAVKHHRSAPGFGMIMAMLNAAILTGPYLTGVFMDFVSKSYSCFFVMAGFTLLSIYFSYRLWINSRTKSKLNIH